MTLIKRKRKNFLGFDGSNPKNFGEHPRMKSFNASVRYEDLNDEEMQQISKFITSKTGQDKKILRRSNPLWMDLSEVLYGENGYFGNKRKITCTFFYLLMDELPNIFEIYLTKKEKEFKHNCLFIFYETEKKEFIECQINIFRYEDIEEILEWPIFNKIHRWHLK